MRLTLYLLPILVLFCNCASVPVIKDIKAIPLNMFSDLISSTSSEPVKVIIPSKVTLVVGAFDEAHILPVINKINQLKGTKTEIWLRIDSTGGILPVAELLIETIEHYDTPISCVVDKHAFSAGLFLLESCPKRFATNRASFMGHEIKTVVTSPSDEEEFLNVARMLKTMNSGWLNTIAHRLNISKKVIYNKIHGKEWWFDTDEALKVGAIDKVIDVNQIPPLIDLN